MLCACGSDPVAATTDGGSDAGPASDAGADTGNPDVANDASGDAQAPWVPPTPVAIALSATGPDQLQSAVAGPNGSFYAAGFAAATATGTRLLTVVKMTAKGPDPSFGTNGVATTALAVVGGADEIDVALQPSGKVVVAATVANDVNPNDRDVAVLRLDGATGALDPSFGVNGVRIVDLNTALDASQAAQRDAARSLAVGANGELFVHAATRGDGVRTDSDFALVKLTVDGALDPTYGNGGKRTLDFGTPSANATPRGIQVLADGSVVASGYASSSLSANTTQPVLYKLTPAGALDATFADNGVFHAVVLTLQTEAYAVALQNGTHVVTSGYGRNTGTTNDWVSLRFALANGARDTSWGGAPNGAVLFDPGGKGAGSNCRNAVALPGGKTLLLGSTGPTNQPAQDAAFAVLDATGKLDLAYGTGITVLPFGSGDGGADQLWGAAVSGTDVLLVGTKGAGATQTEQLNDDAYAVFFTLR
jgi:uncharacterized delta-60 repeat protein